MNENKRREYTFNDVTMSDAKMLMEASSGSDRRWYCYGKAWYKLDALELIDEDLMPTPLGIAVARKIMENIA